MAHFRACGAAVELFKSRAREILCESGAGTGKSFSLMWHARITAEQYPGCKLVFAMATRKALGDTVLPEFEAEVLGMDHHAIYGTAQPNTRYSYRWDNGAEIVLVGLDAKAASRKLSAKYDKLYIFQAEQVSLGPVHKLQSRLRGFRTDAHQTILDCNPGPAFHWLNIRGDQVVCSRNDPTVELHPDPQVRAQGTCPWFGEEQPDGKCPKCGAETQERMLRLRYRHQDNPLLWDHAKRDWTPEGRDYMATLNQLTGVERERLLFHRWVSATGLAVPEYDPLRHIWDPETTPLPRFDYFVGALDWGHRSPGTFQVWGYSKAFGAMILVAEVYKKGWTFDIWAGVIEELVQEFDVDSSVGRQGLFRAIVADPADPVGSIQMLNDRLRRFSNHPSMAFVSAADKRRLPGLNAVREGFRDDRIFLSKHSLRGGVDQALRDAMQPVRLHEELTSLVWREPNEGQPEKEEFDPLLADHAFDTLRYAKMLIDSGDLTPPREGWQPPVGTVGHMLRFAEVLQE